MTEEKPKRSWKTTSVGIALLVSALATAWAAYFDADPLSVLDVRAVLNAIIALTGVSGLGFLLTKDEK